jgi:hypothetical protein
MTDRTDSHWKAASASTASHVTKGAVTCSAKRTAQR